MGRAPCSWLRVGLSHAIPAAAVAAKPAFGIHKTKLAGPEQWRRNGGGRISAAPTVHACRKAFQVMDGLRFGIMVDLSEKVSVRPPWACSDAFSPGKERARPAGWPRRIEAATKVKFAPRSERARTCAREWATLIAVHGEGAIGLEW